MDHCKTDATRCRALPIARRTPLGGCSRTSPRVHRSRAGLRRHLLAPNHAYFSHPRPATLTRSTGHPRPATFTRPSTQRRDELTHPQLLATLEYTNAPVPALVPDCGGGYSAACPTLTASKMECRRCYSCYVAFPCLRGPVADKVAVRVVRVDRAVGPCHANQRFGQRGEPRRYQVAVHVRGGPQVGRQRRRRRGAVTRAGRYIALLPQPRTETARRLVSAGKASQRPGVCSTSEDGTPQRPEQGAAERQHDRLAMAV